MDNLITLADGRKFNPATKEMIDDTPVAETLPENIVFEKKALRLEDLPADPKQVNALNAIIAYELLGLPDMEICHALNCELAQLKELQGSAAYDKLREMIVHSLQETLSHSAHGIIHKEAVNAARVMALGLKSKSEGNKLKAAESILDRAGISAKDMNNGLEGNLTIKIVKDVHSKITVSVN